MAAGRPPARRVPRQRPVRVHRGVLAAIRHARRSPTCSACPKTTTSCSAGARLTATPGAIGGDQSGTELNALASLDDWFTTYIEDRRREPREDVLTDLALAKYPDGSTPDVIAVVRTATFLFAAGQETTARLLATALKHLAEHPELQDELRANRELHPRLHRGGAAHREPRQERLPPRPAHQRRSPAWRSPPVPLVMLLNGAANRDPRRFECPAEFRIDRPNARGAHRLRPRHPRLPGRPARARRGEGQPRADPRPDARHPPLGGQHGPAGARRFEYEPTYILRGLTALHLEFTPV